MAFLRNILQKKEKKTDIQNTSFVTDGISRNSVSPSTRSNTGTLLRPHMTEKTTVAARTGTYAFVVAFKANKQEVKKAIQTRYGVNVVDVRMMNIRGKEIHRGRQIGWKQGMKKAYVTLAKGQTIEVQ